MLPLPDLTQDWELHELERLVDRDAPVDDEFTMAIAPFFSGREHAIMPRVFKTWHCEDCGCAFLADIDGDAVWPDRFVRVSEARDRGECNDRDCRCHRLPYCFAPSEAVCGTCGKPLWIDNPHFTEADQTYHHYIEGDSDTEHDPVPVLPPPSPDEMSHARDTLVRVEHDLTTE